MNAIYLQSFHGVVDEYGPTEEGLRVFDIFELLDAHLEYSFALLLGFELGVVEYGERLARRREIGVGEAGHRDGLTERRRTVT